MGWQRLWKLNRRMVMVWEWVWRLFQLVLVAEFLWKLRKLWKLQLIQPIKLLLRLWRKLQQLLLRQLLPVLRWPFLEPSQDIWSASKRSLSNLLRHLEIVPTTSKPVRLRHKNSFHRFLIIIVERILNIPRPSLVPNLCRLTTIIAFLSLCDIIRYLPATSLLDHL